MDPDLYDEFGNYVGPDLESDSDSDPSEDGGDNLQKDRFNQDEDIDEDDQNDADNANGQVQK